MFYSFKKMNCLNCNNTIQIEQKFCPECGQKTSTARLNTSHILHDVFHAFTHTDKGVLYLIRWLIVKPGTISREYVLGQRKKYFNPFTFLILVIGITTILAAKFSLFSPYLKNINSIQTFFNKHYNFLIFCIVPLIALYTKLLFKRTKINFAESVILSSYTSAERAIVFTLIVTPLIILFRNQYFIIIGVYSLTFACYYGFACCQYFKTFNFKYFLKGLFVILLSQATIAILTYIGSYIFEIFTKH